MISIGAILCKLNANGTIRKYHKPFELYIKPKNKIGKYVVNLTGITEEKLEKDGTSFSNAMKEFKKYCGINFKRASFATFGSHDMRIINQSIVYNIDAPIEICRHIQKNHLDMSEVISEFVKDANGNPMSLTNYCKLFGVEETGPAHNATNDAINLAKLYEAFISNRSLVLDEYKKVVNKMKHLPQPINRIIGKLAKGEDVTAIEFEEELKDYIG
jgi:inhibitor of KinA sporulation pathway (predicted exonuclease)